MIPVFTYAVIATRMEAKKKSGRIINDMTPIPRCSSDTSKKATSFMMPRKNLIWIQG